MPGKCLRDMALGQLDGCEMGLTLESEEGEVPHLRWSQAPPLPWPRPGSGDNGHHLWWTHNQKRNRKGSPFLSPDSPTILMLTIRHHYQLYQTPDQAT